MAHTASLEPCHGPLLGYRFAPQLRDLKDRRLYAFRGQDMPEALAGLVGGTIDAAHLTAHWDDALRLAVSVGSGHATASGMLRRLAGYHAAGDFLESGAAGRPAAPWHPRQAVHA